MFGTQFVTQFASICRAATLDMGFCPSTLCLRIFGHQHITTQHVSFALSQVQRGLKWTPHLVDSHASHHRLTLSSWCESFGVMGDNIDDVRETTCCELTINASGAVCTSVAHQSDTTSGGARMVTADEGDDTMATRCFMYGGLCRPTTFSLSDHACVAYRIILLTLKQTRMDTE